jgi:hypothetical protein
MNPNKLQPALLGGAFIGVFSVLPVISAGNACCCLWVIVGGMLAAYLMQQNHPQPVTAGDGAAVGALAGLIGACVDLAISIPLSLLTGPMQRRMLEGFMAERADIPPQVRDMIEQMAAGPLAIGIGFSLMVVAGLIFGTLGGVLGAMLFKKSPPPAPPAPGVVLPPV